MLIICPLRKQRKKGFQHTAKKCFRLSVCQNQGYSETGSNYFSFHNIDEKNQSKVMWKFKTLKRLMSVSDVVCGKELPDEIDVIVEASTETPGRHLV